MRNHLVAVVLVLISCVAAVFVDDAFVTDWVRHNYKSISRSWLVQPESVLVLAEANRLISLDPESKALFFLVDLAELGYAGSDLQIVPLDEYFVVFLEHKPQLLLFGKNTGVLAETITLNAAPKKVISVSNDGFVVLDAQGTLSAWHSGELGTLASSCTSFNVFAENGVDHVFVEGQILTLSMTENGLEVNTVDPVQLGGDIILKSAIVVDAHHGVSFTQSEVSIGHETDAGIEVVWTHVFDQVSSVELQTTRSATYIVVVTPSRVYFYDIGDFLTSHKQKSITVSEISFPGSFSSAIADENGISVLSVDGDSIHVTKLAVGSSKQTVYSVPKFQSRVTDKCIIVDHPLSLSVIDKAHHLVEDAQTGSDLVRWMKRTKTHLAQFGKATVETLSGEPPALLVQFIKSFEGNIIGLALAKVIGTTSTSVEFENEKYGFEKILVFYDSANKAILAKSTKDGSFIWTMAVEEQDPLLDLISINSAVYAVFTHSVKVLLLRTGSPVFDKTFSLAIDKAIVLDSIITEEEADEGTEPYTIALQFGDSFELLNPEARLAVNQFVVSKEDRYTVQGHKVLDGRLIKTWTLVQDEEIIAISHMEGSLTSAVGITRADRSVLYKYLNPNLLTIVTEAGSSLKVTLIDGATGNVLHVQRHQEIVDPTSINVIQADNWVIYSYLVKYPTVEQRIVVLDLFTTAENAIGGLKSSTAGEYDVSIAQVSSKLFIYPQRILELAATQTKFGITLRSVLALTEEGQLVEIPKFFLNSRRIGDRKMTAADFEDEFKMMPYEPVIMHNNYQVLNHKIKLQPVDKKRQILIKPTELESTAVVCLVNSENEFCTTVLPSLSYDRLTGSFDKIKLLLTIAALFVAYNITKPLVESKKLNNKWLD